MILKPMQTYTSLKSMQPHSQYRQQRDEVLHHFNPAALDVPVAETVKKFARLPHCFPLQSCYGHFCYPAQPDPHNLAPLPDDTTQIDITFRIAYLALCIERSYAGKTLLGNLQKLVTIDPDYVQVGCAEWFWAQYLNSFVIQVSPERYKDHDQFSVPLKEARHIDKRRRQVWDALAAMAHKFQCQSQRNMIVNNS